MLSNGECDLHPQEHPIVDKDLRLAHHQTSSCSRDKLHSHVDEKRVRERVQVRCSDLVGSGLLQILTGWSPN